MRSLSVSQIAHRAYLASPVWKAKRAEALSFYGCICSRCGDWGNDVHHKTYERQGGGELIEDLEVMCRECHRAHHAAERFTSNKSRRGRGIHIRVIHKRLTDKQYSKLRAIYPEMTGNRYWDINFGNRRWADSAARMLGCSHAFGFARERRPDPDHPRMARRQQEYERLNPYRYTKEFNNLKDFSNFSLTKLEKNGNNPRVSN